MERLLKELDKLYSIPGNYEVDDYNMKHYFIENDITKQVVNLCEELLITENGRCNWDNIHALRNNGYSVFAGDMDSYGWLTGCVKKWNDKRILIYG